MEILVDRSKEKKEKTSAKLVCSERGRRQLSSEDVVVKDRGPTLGETERNSQVRGRGRGRGKETSKASQSVIEGGRG